MRIALIDPFYDTSHAQWAEGLKVHSKQQIDIYGGKPNYWKWQMVGGTVEMAMRIGKDVEKYDLLLVTDMLDLPCFLGFLSQFRIPPVVLYFHENQITYPWSPSDSDIEKKRDHHYGFMNFRSALLADQIVFNSEYHRSSFLSALPDFCRQFPKNNFEQSIPDIELKSKVLGIGIEFVSPSVARDDSHTPIFLWNHRWEYDKGPDLFFKILFELKKEGFDFRLIVLGQSYDRQPPIFERAKSELGEHITHWGFAKSREEYFSLVSKSNILMVTAIQDFFGIGVVEGILSGCFPVLPLRLAYLEHIPIDFQSQVFYRDEEELMNLTRKVIREKRYKETKIFQDFVQKYRWDRLAPMYDALFEDSCR